MMIRAFVLRVCVIALLLFVGIPPLRATGDPFPEYESIRPNVEFWTRVFAEWSLGQVVVHDLDYPAIVYEVIDLPGPIEERYTEEQQEFLEELNELWQRRLRSLADKIEHGDPLDQTEKGWVLQVTTRAGTDRIGDAHERVRTQRGLRERFRRGLEISGRYESRIRALFAAAGLPEELAYMPHVESSYQADARSSAGAVGVWQFTRGTGTLYLRIDASIDERLDPIAAAGGAVAYLAEAHEGLDSWPLALTSYNYGLAGMARAVEKLGNDYERVFREYDGRTFGFASKNFYSEFLAARAIAREPERFFPEGFELEPPLDLDNLILDRPATPGRVAGAYGLAVEQLAAINPAWTSRAVRHGLMLPRGSSVWLPAGTLALHGGEAGLPDSGLSGFVDDDGLYVVRRGDSLSAIAQAHGIRLNRLRELNEIPAGQDTIQVGQRLRLAEPLEIWIHVVRRGETLSGIAERCGMTLSELRRINGIASGTALIRSGQRLKVTATDARVHVVRRGDTLLGIALRHGVNFSELLAANRIPESAPIRPGQRIRIPSAR